MTADVSDQAIAILVDGFFDNPVMAWVFEDEGTRAEALEAWYRLWIDAYGANGQLEVDASGDGAALWLAPNAQLAPEFGKALFELVGRFNGDRTPTVLGAFAKLAPPPPGHRYLNSIAARRGARARGIGARLLEPALADSDATGVPIYLESSNPRNLSFYLRYGFENHGERLDLPDGGPPLQPMSRAASRA